MAYYPGLKGILDGLATDIASAQADASAALSLVNSVLSATSATFVPERLLALYMPAESNAASSLGLSGAVATGTGTTPAITQTNLLTARRRVRFTSANAANRWGGFRGANGGTSGSKVTRGSAAGQGGFRFISVFGTETALATQSLAVGLVGSLSNPFVDTTAFTISNLVNSVIVGYDAAGTQLVIMHNDDTGACTSVTLNGGTGFPVDATTLYQIKLEAAPNASTVNYELTNITTGLIASGTLSSNLPLNTDNMIVCAGGGTNAGGGIFVFAIASLVLQTYGY